MKKPPPKPRATIFPAILAGLILGGIILAAWFAFNRTPRQNADRSADSPVRPFQSTKAAPTSPPQPNTAHLSSTKAKQLADQRSIVLANPSDPNAWGKYGMLLRAFDFQPQAAESFRRAAMLDPKNPRWPYYLAMARKSDDPQEYARALAAAVQLCGSEPTAPRFNLARLFAEQGRWEEADKHSTALLQANQAFTPARLLQAQSELARGNAVAAATLAKQCLEDTRTRKAAATLLSSLYQRQGDSASAAETARIVAASPPDQPIFDSFESEITALRGDPRSLSSQVHPLLAARKFAEAEPLIQQLLQDHPDFSETWLVQGRYLLLQKNLAGAEQALRRHLQLETNSVQGWFQLGMTQLTATNLAASAESFRHTVKLKDDFGPAWFNLGVALGRTGKPAEAAEALQQAIRHNPEYLDSYLLLADLRMRQRNYPAATQLLEQAERISPADPRLAALRRRLSTPPAN